MTNSLKLSSLQPAPGYLLVEPVKQDKKTATGIYLPDNVEGEKPQYGTVLAVGSDLITESGTKISAPAKKKDTVVYKKWGGNELEIKKTEYQFLKFDDILAVVKK
jgi:chaperonin GroES